MAFIMMNNDYNVELSRLNQIESVDIPHLENVKMIVKDRVDAHSYEPIIWDHLKTLSDDPQLPDDLTQLRAGNQKADIIASDSTVRIDVEMSNKLDRKVRYLKIYRNDKNLSNEKALIYVHGGAYYGGSAEDTLPFLRLLAAKFNGVIYSVDYSIAPEKPYPAAIEDCLSVLMDICDKHQQISLAGDSAGASIALSVSQLSSNMGICEIYKHILFYPTIVQGSDYNGPFWNDRLIPINPEQRQALHNNYTQFKRLDKIMTKYYLNGANYNLSAPLISPMYADPLVFKKVLVMTGEFDPFRLQDEAFVQKIGMAGCEAEYIRYGGLAHAFLNYVGKIPAVEDALIECAEALNS
ncbi:esterase lipase [Companilactobacillus kimchii DSM 13961 = JCM 10707]|uniref:Esterase lipase n=2 Tax=Companilactobacillus kimchii TaxID=2801452 RepID=A0ABR5NUI4_9LACO|nr:esterase lipase [Companilactobacillus kimchii DSM 13961 = JCM 10707]